MAERETKDSPVDCSNQAETAPVNFVSVLWEELHEIRKLRGRREWNKKDLFTVHPAEVKEHRAEEEAGKLPKQPDDDHVFKTAHREELVGLAFSGGGIRSATFNLGVLQGFAKHGLLPMFDYLSTVSGGGYIGGWLESWIYRARTIEGDSEDAKKARDEADKVARCATPSPIDSSPIRRVQECLKPDRSNKIEHGEPQAICFLREYSNYLTPRMGFLGADAWTAVAIYLRNLILTQTILILFLAFLLLLPYLAVYLTQRLEYLACAGLRYSAVIAAGALAFLAFFGVAGNMQHLTGKDQTGEFPPSARQGWVLVYVAAPLFLAAWCISAWVSYQYFASRSDALDDWLRWAAVGAIGFWVVWLPVAFWGIQRPSENKELWNATRTRFISSLCSIPSGAVGGLLLWVLADKVLKVWATLNGRIWHVVSFGAPLVVVIFLLVVTLQLGLMGMLTPDPRREWWGRLGGLMLLISILWPALFSLAIYSPLGVMWSRRLLTYGSAVWVLNTLTGVLGGKNSKTGSLESPTWKDTALSVTPYVFILGLAAGLATLLEIALGKINCPEALAAFLKGSEMPQKVTGWIISLNWSGVRDGAAYAQGLATPVPAAGPASHPAFVAAHWNNLFEILNINLVAYAAIVAVACLLLAWRVDLNDFSMNLFYRNRLVRCYLGASHRSRKPNPFSGFDPDDDLLVSALQDRHGYGGPFPIVNAALNLVTGQNLAWQERKAESFVFTPLRCGFDTWLERLDLEAEAKDMVGGDIEKYGYRPAACCLHPNRFYKPGGYRLGAAISISGAAASPNMGYHSSPSLAFLMTFFNVRLGYWAGNPRHKSAWQNAGPHIGLFRLIAELFGQSDDEARYVYLSDGGHFENLGLYELVKRRCKYIVVCDADADGDYTFGDLGGAIRKCREDIGVEITLTTDSLQPGKAASGGDDEDAKAASADERFSEAHWAIGKVHYRLVDPGAEDGILVYLKTSLTGDEPADVLNYHREHADFPHQTTADQWFTESQFESYRRLGQHVVEHLLDGLSFEERHKQAAHTMGHSTKQIFDILRDYAGQVE